MKIDGKVAVITGGASGLGAATSKRFIKEGCKVVIADLQEDLGQKLAKELGSDKSLFVKVDVTNEKSIQNMVDEAVKAFGAIHILVNCAGIAISTRLFSSKGTADVYRKMLEVNAIGTLMTCKAVAKQMEKQEDTDPERRERGVIINVASSTALDAPEWLLMYASSKGAVVSMTVPLARAVGKFGVRVVTLSPGTIPTPMAQYASKPEMAKMINRLTPIGRMGHVDEFADWCV